MNFIFTLLTWHLSEENIKALSLWFLSRVVRSCDSEQLCSLTFHNICVTWNNIHRYYYITLLIPKVISFISASSCIFNATWSSLQTLLIMPPMKNLKGTPNTVCQKGVYNHTSYLTMAVTYQSPTLCSGCYLFLSIPQIWASRSLLHLPVGSASRYHVISCAQT